MSIKVGLLLALAVAPAGATSPVQKVLAMLDDVGAKAKSDLADAVADITEAMKFFDKTAVEKDYAMKKSKEIIGALEATIFDEDAKIKECEFSVTELSNQISDTNGELAKQTKMRAKDHAEFLEVEKELVDAVETLEAAMKTGAGGAAFVQLTPEMKAKLAAIKMSLKAVLEAGLVTQGQHAKVAAFLDTDADLTFTTRNSSDGGAGADIFKMLIDHTTGTLSDMRKKEMEAGHEFASTKLTLENEIKSMTDEMKSQQELKQASIQSQAQSKKDLAVEKKVLQEDINYSGDLKRDCNTQAQDFEELHRDAVAELAALAKAKDILTKGVTASLVETKFKLRSARSSMANDDGKERALRAIQALGRKFHSTALVALSYRAAADPFVKVRSMVEEMIAKLQQEAAEDATQEAFCKEEQASSEKSANKKAQKLDTTDARIEKASSSVAALSEAIAEASQEVAETDAALKEATEIRTAEKAHFTKLEADLSGTVEACNEAAKVLEAYYDSSSLLQRSTSGQKGGGSIIDVLRFAESDFAMQLSTAKAAESVAAQRYEALAKESKELKTIKLVEIKGKESEVKSLKTSLANYGSDREGIASELAAVKTYMAELKPKCDIPVESYAAKKERRSQEIAGLREALEMLE